MSNDQLNEALSEYVGEAKEIIERVSSNLSELDNFNLDPELIRSIYRDVHTLKGTSQLFGFQQIAQVAHAIEASLNPVRDNGAEVTDSMLDTYTQALQLMEDLIASIQSHGQEQEFSSQVTHAIAQIVDAVTQNHQLHNDDWAAESAKPFVPKQNTNSVAEPKVSIPKALNSMNSAQKEGAKAMSQSELIQEPVVGISQAGQNTVVEEAGDMRAVAETTIRVQVSLLDRILNLVGELVLVKNQLSQYRNIYEDSDFLNSSKNLEVVTSDLQSEVMRTRMQPIETIVGKYKRVVRDIAKDLGKSIDLTLEGMDTELDKSLLEAIKDPLTHIIRNACDHGIETPEKRVAANKPANGHLLLRSYHEGGQVVIEVSDDGAGIHRERVLQKAIEKGVVNQDAAQKMTDREICELILRPGFSTSDSVTAVSGRGVGMDVVKTNIEKIGGSVEIKSREGFGSTMQLRIPLTLAIVPALLVGCENAKYAIPQVKLVELVRVDIADPNSPQVEHLEGRPMLRLRGQLLPLCSLKEVTNRLVGDHGDDSGFVVVLSTEGERYGLIVPEVLDTADIVVKPLSGLLGQIYAFSGATIMGDGSIALILDVGGVAEQARVISKKLQKNEKENFSKKEKKQSFQDIQEFLLFGLQTETVHSVPLCLVNRLEEIDVKKIEKSGDQWLVQYRGGLLPLISANQFLKYGSASLDNKTTVPVVVIQKTGRYFGIIVDEIHDVINVDSQIDDLVKDRDGIIGNLIHEDQVIVVVDVLGMIEHYQAKTSGETIKVKSGSRNALAELSDAKKEATYKAVRILYAEDVAFFRRHVSKVLAAAGMDVTTFEDGKAAWEEIQVADKDRYNLILSDIEMPHMDGLELAKKVRGLEGHEKTPMIALTTRFRDIDVDKGHKAGFDEYLEKLNPEKLLEAISKLVQTQTSQSTAVTAQERSR